MNETQANELHTVLSEAYDKAAAEPAVDATPEPTPAVETSTAPETAPVDGASPPASERPRDEQGRFKATETSTSPAATEKPKAAATATEKPAAGTSTATPAPKAGSYSGLDRLPNEDTPPVLKPPQSWRPVEREAWNKAPREVQEAVSRREREITTKLNEVAEATKAWDSFRQIVQPYDSMIRASGAQHPLQAVQNLLQTAMVLRQGTPAEKAQMAARIVRDFGVGIEELDSALAGEAPQQQAQALNPDALVAQIEQRFQQRLQTQAQQLASQRRDQEFAAFAQTHEFAPDVRADMEMFIEAGNRKGIAIGLDDAYARACALNPEITKVLEQRKAAEAAKAQIASTQASRQAASSIRSQPTAAPAAQPTDLREILSKKYDEIAGR